jgi:hypothetical protein
VTGRRGGQRRGRTPDELRPDHGAGEGGSVMPAEKASRYDQTIPKSSPGCLSSAYRSTRRRTSVIGVTSISGRSVPRQLPFAIDIGGSSGGTTRGCRVAATRRLRSTGRSSPWGLARPTRAPFRCGCLRRSMRGAAIARQYADDVHIIAVDGYQQALRRQRALRSAEFADFFEHDNTRKLQRIPPAGMSRLEPSPECGLVDEGDLPTPWQRQSEVTCDNCFFRRGLCALAENVPCHLPHRDRQSFPPRCANVHDAPASRSATPHRSAHGSLCRPVGRTARLKLIVFGPAVCTI